MAQSSEQSLVDGSALFYAMRKFGLAELDWLVRTRILRYVHITECEFTVYANFFFKWLTIKR